MKKYCLTVSDMDESERIDKYLSSLIPELSRTFIQKQIEYGNLCVNGKPVKSNYKVKAEDNVIFNTPDSVIPDIVAENIPIDIVYEDNDVCIVNKPRGMVVHPSHGHYTGTLVNALLYHLAGRLSGINGVLRPGIVHRIDKDTSGLLIICKNDISHQNIAMQLKDHSCNRVYHAIVHGNFDKEEGSISGNIGRSPVDRKKMAVVPEKEGKPAITHYRVLKQYDGYSYVELKLETGRTHQIRVHMANIGHPLMGDPLYCCKNEPVKTQGQMLHAKTIGFVSPTTHDRLEFDSVIPDDFAKCLRYLEDGLHK